MKKQLLFLGICLCWFNLAYGQLEDLSFEADEMEMNNFPHNITLKKNAFLIWKDLYELRAGLIEYASDPETGPIKLVAQQAATLCTPEVFLKADEMDYQFAQKKLELKKNVQIHLNQLELSADYLVHDEQTGTGKSTALKNQQVKVIFTLDEKFQDQKADFCKNLPQPGKKRFKNYIEISAKVLDWSIFKQQITFSGGTEFWDTESDTRLTAKKLQIRFDTNQKLDSAIATGSINIVQKDKSVTANKAEINFNQKIVTMNGNVVAKEPGQPTQTSETLEIPLEK